MDIVERLRLGGPNAAEVTDEAADEIERLRAALEFYASWPSHPMANVYRFHVDAGEVARKALGETDE